MRKVNNITATINEFSNATLVKQPTLYEVAQHKIPVVAYMGALRMKVGIVMKVFNMVIAVIGLLLVVACAKQSSDPTPTPNNQNNEQEVIIDNEIEGNISDVIEPVEKQSEFSLYYDNNYISLKDWDNEVNIIEILGSPVSEEITELPDNADTHAGSFTKTLTYDGLVLTLFSPKQNGESFWIVSINVTNEKYSTANNVTVGDSLQILKETYPTIEIYNDERTDPNNSAYVIVNNENHLLFEVENGLVKEIELYYEIN